MKQFKKHFEQFSDNESDFVISQKIKRKYKVENKENRIAETEELYNVCQILNTFNVKYWIDYGTLLGAFRKNKLIDYDRDIDISLILNNNVTLLDITNVLSKDYYIRHYEPYYLCIYPKNNKDFGFAHIDFYGFEELEDKKIIQCKIPGSENLIYRSYFFDTMSKIKIEDYEFPCPRHTDLFLELLYGDDYLIEKKSSCCGNSITKIDLVKTEIITVYLNGVFDLFHIGHLNMFKKCKKYFDRLIVGVHNDEDVMKYKHKPIIEYKDRLEIVKSCKYIDEIVENAPLYTNNEYLNNLGAKYLIYGEEEFTNIKRFYNVSNNRVHTFHRTENISSTIIKNRLNM